LNFLRERHDRSNIIRINGYAFRFLCDPAIPRRAPDFLHQWALLQFPNQRVFPSAPANHQNLHPQYLMNTPVER
jgi:hypothetical protein